MLERYDILIAIVVFPTPLLIDQRYNHLEKEAFVKGEGTTEKASDMPMLNVRAKPELIKRVKMACVHEEMTIQEFVNRAVEKELKEMGY
jgi:hypothetical protein